MFPPIATVASLANGYLAWTLRDRTGPTVPSQSLTSLSATATVVALGMVSWTLTAMKSTNDRLRAHAKRDNEALAEGTEGMVFGTAEKFRRAKEDDKVPRLMWRWAMLNFCRSLFPLAGAVIGFCGVIRMK
ncbi:hypothetical protein F1880_005142 [Penicillium rolfsii]|nr:hypothetical protein F1880_005142 [Penicillium rolfsii]